MFMGPNIFYIKTKKPSLNPRKFFKTCIYDHITSVTFSTQEKNVSEEVDFIAIRVFMLGAHTEEVSNI